MNHNEKSSAKVIATAVKWAARLLSLASIGFVLFFMIGERFNPLEVRPREWPLFACFPFGICAGMVLAWWRQGWGGCVTLACLLGFYAMNFAVSGKLPRGPWFAILAAPGALFLLSSLLAGRRSKATIKVA